MKSLHYRTRCQIANPTLVGYRAYDIIPAYTFVLHAMLYAMKKIGYIPKINQSVTSVARVLFALVR